MVVWESDWPLWDVTDSRFIQSTSKIFKWAFNFHMCLWAISQRIMLNIFPSYLKRPICHVRLSNYMIDCNCISASDSPCCDVVYFLLHKAQSPTIMTHNVKKKKQLWWFNKLLADQDLAVFRWKHEASKAGVTEGGRLSSHRYTPNNI